MALNVTIGGEGTLFVGTDKILRFNVVDVDGAAVDVTGRSLRFIIKKTINTATVLDVVGTISGAFASSNNPQRVLVTLTDALLTLTPGTYQYSLKVEDFPEDIFAYGDFVIERATQ